MGHLGITKPFEWVSFLFQLAFTICFLAFPPFPLVWIWPFLSPGLALLNSPGGSLLGPDDHAPPPLFLFLTHGALENISASAEWTFLLSGPRSYRCVSLSCVFFGGAASDGLPLSDEIVGRSFLFFRLF